MERNVLIARIINFCFTYNVVNDESIEVSELTNVIEKMLEEAYFLESLINTIIIASKKHSGIDIEEVKTLLIELEKIRLELEYSHVS
ncbi:MAG: hypothetical protein FWC73_02630 [Defluviitaleaceae bacterium]|nr:hypothetical protein [Defluviitaleaceae bacterium]